MEPMGRIAKHGLAAGLAAILGGCAIATPFKSTEFGLGVCKGSAVVSVTEARVRPDAESRAVFWRNVWAVADSLPSQSGLIGYSVRREPLGDTAWTMTLWADEPSLLGFMYSGRHKTAMAEANGATASMRFARFTRDCTLGPPSWDEALARLAETGRAY